MRYLRLTLGACTWLAAAALLWWCAAGRDPQHAGASRRAAEELWQFAAGERHTATLEFAEPALLGVGDPIFVADEQGFRQVGEIRTVAAPHGGGTAAPATASRAEALFYSSAPPLSQDSRLVYHTTPDSMEWVLETMLPPEKREQIAGELSSAFEQHHEEILAELMPIVEASLTEGFSVVEQDLAAALESRRDKLEALGGKYQREIVEQELVPLVRTEIWPIVRQHAEPKAGEIGQELWQRASVWRFGWRYLYDKSFMPKQDLFKKEWERYLEEEATPVMVSHTDDLIETQKQILADVAKNEKVQESVRRNLSRIIDDPELRTLVWEIIQEVIIDNPRLHEVLQRHWTSPEAQAAFRLAAERLQPTVERIGRLLFGDEESGITPEFARVLRSQILHKDRRWLVLEGGAGDRRLDNSSLKVTLGLPGGPVTGEW